jgi:hypothetical protein
MTPGERVEAVLRGERADWVPFTVYENWLPRGTVERALRNKGLCVIVRGVNVFRTTSPNVTREQVRYEEDGGTFVRTNVSTPVKELYQVERVSPDGRSAWHVERLFGGPEDYGALEFMIRDREYVPNYEEFERAQEMWGGDGFVRAGIGYSPLQEILFTLMGVEAFAVEWAERRDEVMRLYDALTESRRKQYPIVAGSPALAANYGGNVSAEVVGLERFEKYYVPHYNEFAGMMHDHGKLVGVHFDANTWAIEEAIGASEIDYVEAFTPRPDGDMGLSEARAAWPDKVLWINFPSSLHLRDADGIEEATRQMLWEAAPGDRLMIGITEEVPPDRWLVSFPAILKVINWEGKLPIEWKSSRRPERETADTGAAHVEAR